MTLHQMLVKYKRKISFNFIYCQSRGRIIWSARIMKPKLGRNFFTEVQNRNPIRFRAVVDSIVVLCACMDSNWPGI